MCQAVELVVAGGVRRCSVSVGLKNGRVGTALFSVCGPTYMVHCVTDLSQICVPECIGPGLQPDCDQSIILVESN